MPDGSISQEELDSLFGLDELSIEKPKHVWLVKATLFLDLEIILF